MVEPTTTEHLFVAEVGAQTRQVRIEVTDRFGQVYTDTLTA
ncbi:hypothetical protein [Hymenobacter sp. AT01-02]|nr:hypothetical protein [Hymenobacter sp. AT01-02]